MKKRLFWLCNVFALALCAQRTFDLQGHRGARGLYPENTIPGFLEAIKLGVNTLEMDVVVSKDHHILLSHEPWMSEEICTLNGERLGQHAKAKHNIYQLTYNEIVQYDCGSLPHPRFPRQAKISVQKPLLTAVIDTVENFLKQHKLPEVYYNIETKCTPAGDGIHHPAPDTFARLLYDLLKKKNILPRCIIQSFDVRTLQAMHAIDSSVVLALLVENPDGIQKNIERLGFTPAIYSPYYRLVTRQLIRRCHEQNMRIIPWTINQLRPMKRLYRMGVDGIITDYPDVAKKLPLP